MIKLAWVICSYEDSRTVTHHAPTGSFLDAAQVGPSSQVAKIEANTILAFHKQSGYGSLIENHTYSLRPNIQVSVNVCRISQLDGFQMEFTDILLNLNMSVALKGRRTLIVN